MNVQLEMPAPTLEPCSSQSVKKRILLVDDDPAIRKILLRLLLEEDYLVATARDGDEALRMAKNADFDLVLLDLNMPVKDGWQVFEELTTDNPALRIIFITARPDQYSPALAAGVAALLEKPLDFAKLFYTIRNLLEEPAEVRLSRMAGRPSVFHYSPAM